VICILGPRVPRTTVLTSYRPCRPDKYFGPSKGVVVCADGYLPEQVGDALDAGAPPVRPRVEREHLVAREEVVVLVTVGKSATAKTDGLAKAEKIMQMNEITYTS
jgi:hypothetical protein